MSSSHYGSYTREEREASKEILYTNVNISRPHHQHRLGGGTTACFVRDVEVMIANMRNISQQNTVMQQFTHQVPQQDAFQ